MTDISILGIAIDSSQVKTAGVALDDLAAKGGKAETATTALSKATDILASAAKAAASAFGLYKMAEYAKDAALLAARYETMGVVMRVAGNNAGYTMTQMEDFSKSLQKSGISMLQSRNSLTQLATANIDLAQATKLGRAAQDLAVVSQTNSSDALGRMIIGIKSGQTEILRTMGLNVSFETGYKTLAASMGKTTSQLTEHDKTLARTTETLKEAARYNGIYEQSMTTAGKAMSSLDRYFENVKILLGNALLPALAKAVFDVTDQIKGLNKELENTKVIGDIGVKLAASFDLLLTTIAPLAKVTAAYFALFVAAPAIFTATSTAVMLVVDAVALHVYGVAMATTSTIGLNTVLFGTSVNAELAAGSLTMLGLAAKGLFAAFVGWEIGTYLRDQFVEVRVAGLAFIGAILTGFENLKYWAQLAGAAIASLVPGTDSYAVASARLTEAHKKELAAIDDNIVGLVAYELATDNAGKTATKVAGMTEAQRIAAGKASKDAEDAAEKAATAAKKHAGEMAKAAKAYKAVQDSADKYVATLAKEANQLGLTDKEKALYNMTTVAMTLNVGKERDSFVKVTTALIEQTDAYKKAVAIAKERADLRQKESDGIDAWMQAQTDAYHAAVQGSQDALAAARAEYEQLGLSKAQIAEITLLTMQSTQAKFVDGSEGYLALQKQIDAQKELIGWMKKTKIKQAGLDAQKEVEEAWKHGWEETDRIAREAFTGWAENGKSMAETIGSALKKALLSAIYEATIRPIALNLYTSITGGGAAGPGSTAVNAINGYSAGSTMVGAFSAYGIGNTAGTMAANVTGTGIDGLLATNGAYGTAAGGAQFLAYLPQIAAVLAAIYVLDQLTSGEMRSGGQYGYSTNGVDVLNPRRGTTVSATGVGATFLEGPSGGDPWRVQTVPLVNSIYDSINATLISVGSHQRLTGMWAGYETSGDNRGGVGAGGTLSGGQTFGQSGRGDNYAGTLYDPSHSFNLDPKNVGAEFGLELQQTYIRALEAAGDLPKTIDTMLRDANGAYIDASKLTAEQATALMTNIGTVVSGVAEFNASVQLMPWEALKTYSFDAAAGLIAASGGLQQLGTNLGTFYSNFYTAEEQRAQAAKNMQTSVMDAANAMPHVMPAGSTVADAINAALTGGGAENPFVTQIRNLMTQAADPNQTATQSQALRDEYRRVVEQSMLDTSTEGQRLTAVLLANAGAFSQLEPAAAAAAAAISTVDTALQSLKDKGAQLAVDLMRLQGNGAGADSAQYALDTAGMTAAQQAQFNINAGIQAQIAALISQNELIKTNAGLQDQLDVLQGRRTQTQVDRENALGAATDDSTRSLIRQVYAQQDLASAVEAATAAMDSAQGLLQSAIAAQRSQQAAEQQAAAQASQQAAQAAAQAANAIRDALASAGQSIADFVKTLRNSVATPANLAAQYKTDLLLAQNGDLEASKRIPASGRAYLDSQIAHSATSFDAVRATARMANELGALPAVKSYQDKLLDAVNATTTAVGGTTSAVVDLNGKLVVDLTVAARSEIVKLISFISNTDLLPPDLLALALKTADTFSKTVSFITGAALPADLKALALGSQSTLTKTITWALGSNALPPNLMALALSTTSTVSKTIALAATAIVNPNNQRLALMTTDSITKTIALAIGSDALTLATKTALLNLETTAAKNIQLAILSLSAADQAAVLAAEATSAKNIQLALTNFSGTDLALIIAAEAAVQKNITAALAPGSNASALALALAQSNSVTQTITASGGTLTADQRLILSGVSGSTTTDITVAGAVTWSADNQLLTIFKAIEASTGWLKEIHGYLGLINAQQSYLKEIHGYLGVVHADLGGLGTPLQVRFERGGSGTGVYAAGGVFTNGIVTSPTYFNQGLMGEAGPEAIMPLANIGGSLGVRFAGSSANEALVAEIRALREEVKALRSENSSEQRSIAVSSAKTASILDDSRAGGRYINVKVVTP